jgi:hypothetical protein
MNAALILLAALFAADAPPADDEVVQIPAADLAKFWTRDSTNVAEGIGPKEIARDAAGCAAVGFIIEKDGSTSSFKLLRDMPPQRFASVAKKVVANLHFSPTERNAQRQAVFTFMTISFRGSDMKAVGSNSTTLISVDDRLDTLCAVKDLQ